MNEKGKQVSRRDFLRLAGVGGGAAAATALAQPVARVTKVGPNGYKYRDRSARYPSWVKTVDEITTEFDLAKTEKASKTYNDFITPETKEAAVEAGKQFRINGIKNNVPGETLADVALYQAGLKVQRNILPAEDMPTPDEYGVDRWSGSEEDASNLLEASGTLFGAAQIGFSALEPKWLKANVEIDPGVDEITTKEDGTTLIPERFKYVVSIMMERPHHLMKRAPTALGSAADRNTYLRLGIARNGLTNFITGLGYGVTTLPGQDVPHAIRAGLGELGRVNRMISPIYGGNVCLSSLLTDLPMALDQPIDFGLQEFCKSCKKCAEACPADALSTEDEPTWEPAGGWQVPGKKTWYEDSPACHEFWTRQDSMCSTCMAACPWSKLDETALHDIAKFTGATVPSLSSLLVAMDDRFGYGLIEQGDPEMEEWWKYDLPPFNIEPREI